MDLIAKILKYTAEHDLSDIHIRADQPMSLRAGGEILSFPDDIITKDAINEFWKANLTAALYKTLIISAVGGTSPDRRRTVESVTICLIPPSLFRVKHHGLTVAGTPQLPIPCSSSDVPS